MGTGCYDLDGKCVNCKQYHPCSFEIEDVTPDEQERWDDIEEQECVEREMGVRGTDPQRPQY